MHASRIPLMPTEVVVVVVMMVVVVVVPERLRIRALLAAVERKRR